MAVAAQPMPYLSATSANALISDLRPTTFSAAALTHLNTLLDELLIALLTSAQSLNPFDLRREAIPSFFSGDRGSGDTTGVRALGRNAVAEAEVELRSWQEGRSVRGYPPDWKGYETRNGRSFPLLQAVELMRVKCVALSTLAPQDESDQMKEQQAVADWLKVGGDASEETIMPSALWITAIIEHVCEHILSSVARIARDSETAVAGPQDLYTALCEDESVWGFFKRMKVKDQLELTIRSTSRSKRFNASRSPPDDRSQGRASPALSTASPGGDASIDTARTTRVGSPSIETSSTGGIAGGVIRKGSRLKRGPTGSPVSKVLQRAQHERSGSALSANTRFILGAFHDTYEQEENQSQDEADQKEAQDEFDQLVRSGETLKVSLTPGRLKSFEAGNRKEPHPSAVADIQRPSTGLINDKRRSHSIARVPVPSDPPTPSPNLAKQSSSDTPVSTPPSRPSFSPRRTSESARKLVARTAKAIEEQDEEDELRGAARSQKKSLFDLLADDSFGPAEPKQTPTRRTVPAVILGTPPPPPPLPPTSASSSRRKAAPGPINNPPQTQLSSPRPKKASYTTPIAVNAGDVTVLSEDDEIIHVQRNRTEAQELADFFNSEPPPGLMQDDEFHSGQPSSSKSKGFRGFISKVSLSSKKKDDDKYRPPLPVKQHSQTEGQASSSTSLSQLNSLSSTAQGKESLLWEVRKQKSMGNMMTGMQSAFRNDQPEPPFPPAPIAATEYSTPIFQQQHVSPLRIHTPPKAALVSVHQREPAFGENMAYESPGTVLHQTVQSCLGSGSVEEVAGPDATNVSVTSPIDPVNMSSERRLRLSSPNSNGKKPLVIGKTTFITPAATSRTPSKNISATPFESPTIGSPAGAWSFTTANEGSDSERSSNVARTNPAELRSSESDWQTPVPASCGVPVEEFESQSVPLPPLKQTSEPVTPRDAVPKQDLVPLRNLLDHATSVSECRLLLNAILTQFGVPYPDLEACQGEEGKGKGKHGAAETPEGRVIAWLLAGREGPVGDYLRQPQAVVPVPMKDGKNDSTSNTDHDQLNTPIRINSAVLSSKFIPLPCDEDIVSPSATTTEFTTTDGETLETVEGQVECVKTGEREEARLFGGV
ncbi:hypothetical protein AYX14_01106 [Cryptococcus neoformans]|nr:hypothetical protein AYX14_01106 [Cryptococcus neoformans var. grubii]